MDISRRVFLFRAVPAVVSTVAFFDIGAAYAAADARILTLADWAQRLDPDGKTTFIVEFLNQTNEILGDMRWMQGSGPMTVRAGLPVVAWQPILPGM